jgi:hypothetical protein
MSERVYEIVTDRICELLENGHFDRPAAFEQKKREEPSVPLISQTGRRACGYAARTRSSARCLSAVSSKDRWTWLVRLV